MASRTGIGVAVLVSLGALVQPGGAWGYALNSHVAICQHVLDRVREAGPSLRVELDGFGVADATAADSTLIRKVAGGRLESTIRNPWEGVTSEKTAPKRIGFTLDPQHARIILAYPQYFRGGCGAPDAYPFFGNTDPTHSYGWDPVGIFETLWQHAESDAQRAWVLGWGAHLMTDAAVHAFANTYAGRAMKSLAPDDYARRMRELSLKKDAAPSDARPRPMVWDADVHPNFIGHVTAEIWLSRHYVYATRPESYEAWTPEGFARKMFLSRGSPIVRHYSRLLTLWKKETPGDVVTEIGGEKPGRLGTLFHQLLIEILAAQDGHRRGRAVWDGHAIFHAGKDPVHYALAVLVANWHKRQDGKLEKILDEWMACTLRLQTIMSSRAPLSMKTFDPFLDALLDYAIPDPLDIQSLCRERALSERLCRVAEKVKDLVLGAIAPFQRAAKKIKDTLLAPLRFAVEKMVNAVEGIALRHYFDRAARDHARQSLESAGLRADSEPTLMGARPKSVEAGIDGAGPTPRDNAANRAKLLRYPFYRNAFVGVLAILADRGNVRGLPSADFTNGVRCTKFFRGSGAILLKGPAGHEYDATTEICHSPIHSRIRDASFASFPDQLSPVPSSGFSIPGVALGAVGSVAKVVANALSAAVQWVVGEIRAALAAIWDSLKVAVEKMGHQLHGYEECLTKHVRNLAWDWAREVRARSEQKATLYWGKVQSELAGLSRKERYEVAISHWQRVKREILDGLESQRAEGAAKAASWFGGGTDDRRGGQPKAYLASKAFNLIFGQELSSLEGILDADFLRRVPAPDPRLSCAEEADAASCAAACDSGDVASCSAACRLGHADRCAAACTRGQDRAACATACEGGNSSACDTGCQSGDLRSCVFVCEKGDPFYCEKACQLRDGVRSIGACDRAASEFDVRAIANAADEGDAWDWRGREILARNIACGLRGASRCGGLEEPCRRGRAYYDRVYRSRQSSVGGKPRKPRPGGGRVRAALDGATIAAIADVCGYNLVRPPKLQRIRVYPSKLPSGGGSVELVVIASDDVGVTTASALMMRPDGRRSGARMSLSAGTAQLGLWRQSYKLPANTGNAPAPYAFTVVLSATSGKDIRSEPQSVVVEGRRGFVSGPRLR